MRAQRFAPIAVAAACAAGTAILASCGGAETPDAVLARLPAEVGGLRAAGADEAHPAAAIFSYLDGGAEVYLAYNLRSCHVRRYAGAGLEVIVDVFDMGSSADAFGVFSRDLDGETVDVGQGGRLRPGWLSAWKGRFYVSITADRDDEAARRALLDLGRAVASAIGSEGPPPAMLRRLPANGIEADRLAYAHDHVTLATLVALPEGNPLGLDKATEVAVGRYRRGAAVVTLLLVRHADAAAAEGAPRAGILHEMLDSAVTALVDVAEPAAAWRMLFAPGDVVGVKSNGWRRLATPPALEDAVVARARAAGVAADAVAVDDQGVLRNPVFRRATALVNMRPMRTHHWAGLGTLLKNYIMFVEEPWTYHDNACERLGEIWTLPLVRGKTRLNVLVMLTPLFHGVGPHHFNRAYTWPYAGLLVSRDAVAADAVGAAIISARRREHFGEERPIAPSPHHIAVADTRFGIGVSRLDAIDLVRLGERAGSLA